MSSPQSIVNYYIEMFQKGAADDAFHGLIESKQVIIPILIAVYQHSDDPDTKCFLVDVVGQFRLVTSINFLCEALGSEEPEIWKTALDGLAMLKSVACIKALEGALTSVTDEKKRSWIAELISDMNSVLGLRAELDSSSYP